MIERIREQLDRETAIWLMILIVVEVIMVCGALFQWTDLIENFLIGK